MKITGGISAGEPGAVAGTVKMHIRRRLLWDRADEANTACLENARPGMFTAIDERSQGQNDTEGGWDSVRSTCEQMQANRAGSLNVTRIWLACYEQRSYRMTTVN